MILGDYRIEIIPDAEFGLDGGAMFGIVPRVLWEKVYPPDELNRIKIQANCLFVETPKEKILIETGMGEKWDKKQSERFAINRKKSFAQTLLEKTGCKPEDITIVINTHLHFDHAGGNTVFDDSGKIVPQFPNARYFISASELKKAENPHEREKASYLLENWLPLKQTGQLELKPDEYYAVEGIKLKRVKGHTETMQTVKIEQGGKILYGFVDLIPTTAHLPFAWIMAYDLYPVSTLAFKKRIIPLAIREKWICWFYHDPVFPLCKIEQVEGKPKASPIKV
ncbi:MAG: MBL fold metallo-hydrolase [Pyrinomonadaceae bacterium]|nr:MBL fold metallo-hydrolase [Pyrinomonadaceae bacterium]